MSHSLRMNRRLRIDWSNPRHVRRYRREWMRRRREDPAYIAQERTQQTDYRRRKGAQPRTLRERIDTARLRSCVWCRHPRTCFILREVELAGRGVVHALVPYCGRC